MKSDTKTHALNHCTHLSMLLALIFFFSACSNYEDKPQYLDTETSIRTLSILAPNIYYSVLRSTEAQIDNFSLDITTYSVEERNQQLVRLQVMLMAGQKGYDLFFDDGHPLWIYASTGLLTDIYELIDACPQSSIEDFHLNILNAFEFNGGLFVFPLSFGFTYVGINANVSFAFINQFAALDTMTTQDILKIYNSLQQEYGSRFEGYYVGNKLEWKHSANAVYSIMTNFIDFQNRISLLNRGEFAVALEKIKPALNAMGVHSTFTATFPLSNQRFWNEQSRRYIFFAESFALSPINALFPSLNPYFLHFIPLADEQGRLLIEQGVWSPNSSWGNICIPVSGNRYLAWEFTTYLLTTMMNHEPTTPESIGFWGELSFTTPIKRNYFDIHTVATINTTAERRGLDVTPQEITDAISLLTMYNEMPSASVPYLPLRLFEDPLQEFLLGTTSARDMAQSIHDRVTLWFMEIE